MADFAIAYTKFIAPIEGGYVNDPVDKGGETYAGIARNFNQSWKGWEAIDYTKRVKGPIKRNTKFPELDYLVTAFYKTLWDKNFFGSINNQDVANILYDWFINSGSNAFYTKSDKTDGVQEILNHLFNAKISADGAMGMQTVNAINSVDPIKLQTELKRQRLIFYDTIIANNPSQAKFKEGWYNRLKAFPDLVSKNPVKTGLILVGALALLAGYIYVKQQGMITT
jgi:lysozyme family protein